MTPVQRQALRRLQEGLAFHDSFGPLPDDAPVMILENGDSDTLFELSYGDGRLQLGHLRDIASILGDEG